LGLPGCYVEGETVNVCVFGGLDVVGPVLEVVVTVGVADLDLT